MFHCLSLHKSECYRGNHDDRELVKAGRYMDTLVRLSFFYDLAEERFDYLLKRFDEVLGEMFVVVIEKTLVFYIR